MKEGVIVLLLFFLIILVVIIAGLFYIFVEESPCRRYTTKKTKREKALAKHNVRKWFWFGAMKVVEIGIPITYIILTICLTDEAKVYLHGKPIDNVVVAYIGAAIWALLIMVGFAVMLAGAGGILVLKYRLVKYIYGQLKQGLVPLCKKIGGKIAKVCHGIEDTMVRWVEANERRAENIAKAGSIYNYYLWTQGKLELDDEPWYFEEE